MKFEFGKTYTLAEISFCALCADPLPEPKVIGIGGYAGACYVSECESCCVRMVFVRHNKYGNVYVVNNLRFKLDQELSITYSTRGFFYGKMLGKNGADAIGLN
jgi:hypothetical protein